jgi:hypothetical protein
VSTKKENESEREKREMGWVETFKPSCAALIAAT